MKPGVVALVGLVACGDNRTPTCPLVQGAPTPRASEPPPLALGRDAYGRWDEWPRIQLGVRAYMRSTYDRSGGNRAADASHFLHQRADGVMVPLDLEGPGELVFVRHNHWHGSPWSYAVDGRTTIVTETSTADPTRPVAGSRFEPASAFPPPLAVTWSDTRGADLSWVPIGFERSFQLGYGRTHYGTGYFIFDRYPDGSAPPVWDASPPPPEAPALLARAGDDLAPVDACRDEGVIDVPAAGVAPVIELAGPATIRSLGFAVARADAAALAAAHLRITWDDRALPSIDAPVALFFGTGTLFDRDGDGRIVEALPMSVRFEEDVAVLATYLPMPFTRGARIELVGGGIAVPAVRWHVRTVANDDPVNWNGYLHATYRDHPTPTPGADLVLLDTGVDEGGGSWCGAFIGTAFTFSDRAVLWTLEGDPRFFFDGAGSPQAYGTGTEEWAGGGDYWGGQTMTLPLVGHPVGAPSATDALGPEDLVQSAYRYLLADRMPFGASARIQLEHGPVDDAAERYRTVTYWYGAPGACLVESDRLDVGDLADEARHDYVSPAASSVMSATSTWDAAGPSAPTTEDGRTMTGTTELTLAIPPDNRGVLLRRTLDYSWPDQRAEVWIADAAGGAFEPAGIWYLAGSTRHVFSNPPGELDAPAPEIFDSPHRWRDDELLIPRRLTEGRSALRIRIVHAPLARPLLPTEAPAARAWSELRYTAFAYVMP